MGHRAAAQHPDPDPVVEQRQIHRGLHVIDLPVVLGVQAVVTTHDQLGDRAVPA
jgi:hypothetical protein